MSDPLESIHLKIPYLAAAQAQKHVTHNEALRRLDTVVQLSVIDAGLAEAPVSLAEGDRYIVANAATGAWANEDGNLAVFVDGGWQFLAPDTGWLAFDVASATLLVRQAATWEPAAGFLDTFDQLGINATADATNRLSVRSNAVLFSNIEDAGGGTGDVRFVVNKEAAADTASLLFQTGFSGRAEVGLAGDDDFVFKVSPDGSAWTEAIRVDKDTGFATILYDNGASGLTATTVQDAIDEVAAAGGGVVSSVFGRTGAVAAAASDYDAGQVDYDNGASGLTAANVQDAIDEVAAAGGGVVASVFGRTGAVAAAASDYDASQVDNDSGVAGATIAAALDGLDGAIGALDAAKQDADADLTAIAALAPSNDDVIQRKAGAWVNRTMAAVKSDLALTKGDVGLGNVDNTADAGKPVSTATQTALDGKQSSDADLTALAGLGATGIAVRTATDAWAQRSLAAGAGMAVANGDGVSGDPTVAVDIAGATDLATPARDDELLIADTDAAGAVKKADVASVIDLAKPTEAMVIACGDETTALTAGTAKVTFRVPYAFTVTAVRASLTTAQASGNTFTVDVNENGASILSTKLTIDNTEKTSTTAAAAPAISDASLADDAEMTIDIDQIGNGSAAGLKVTLIGHRT